MRHAWLLALLAGCVTTADKPPLTDAPPGGTGVARTMKLELPRYPGQEPWRLADEQGHVVLLEVWATWCDPCREALPMYQDLQREFAERGLRIYTINIDAQPALIAPFLAEAKLSLPVLLDPEGRAAERVLKVKMMPTTFLFDRRGVLRHLHEGFDEGRLSTWLSEIEHLLNEPAQ